MDITPIRSGLRKGSRLKWHETTWGEVLAEFLGTFVLLLVGDGCVALAVVGLPGSGRTVDPTTFFMGSGDWMLIVWGWAFAVTFGVYVAGGVSGAHINPAVTLAFAIRRKFPWNKVLPYWGAQFVGAFAGAALVYANYWQAIDKFNAAAHTVRDAAGGIPTFSIFATFPAAYYHSSWGPFLDQIIGTAILMLLIAAVIDERNMGVKANMGPFIIGLTVAVVGISFGTGAGYAINPARDFGPRLFAWIEGWGRLALPGTVSGQFSWYFWVPIVGPLIGGVVGILVYDFFIGDILHSRNMKAAAGE
jgi:glycerol uptake facilitator protein